MGSDDEGAGEKKKKGKKAKKVVKKKEKKEKEASPPKLKLDLGDSKPKVSKAKMFQQAAEEKPKGEQTFLVHFFFVLPLVYFIFRVLRTCREKKDFF